KLDQRAHVHGIGELGKAGDEIAIDGGAETDRRDQRQRGDLGGMSQRQFGRDRTAKGMADEVCAGDAYLIEKTGEDSGKGPDAAVADVGVRAPVAGKVEGEYPAAREEGRQREHPSRVVGAEAVDEDEGILATAAGDRVNVPPADDDALRRDLPGH